MTDLAEVRRPSELATAQPEPTTPARLTQAQKAAIIIGVIGADAAGPIVEQMDENMMRNFAAAMSTLKKIEPDEVHEIISEFVTELDKFSETVRGGIGRARELMQDYVAEAVLNQIMNEVDSPASNNVWKRLATTDEQALAEFLSREHPQTAAVVLSKLPAEQAAKVLGRLDAETARDMVFGLTKAASLETNVVDAIGYSVSEDFLANIRGGGSRYKPAERIGSIMNYTTGEIRQAVLGFLEQTQPELSEAVKGSMFTFQDIHERIQPRDMVAIVRNTEQEILLRALKGAEDNAPASLDFVFSSISSRMAEQLRESLGEFDKVKIREAEEAQQAILKVIRDLEAAGELKLIEIED